MMEKLYNRNLLEKEEIVEQEQMAIQEQYHSIWGDGCNRMTKSEQLPLRILSTAEAP